MDLEVEIGKLPTHAVYVTVTEERIHVTVSPNVEPQVLAALNPEIALKVAEAVDAANAEQDQK